MNLGEIINRVQRQFGDEAEAQITRADITNWANDAQLDIVRKTECLQFHFETDSIANDGSYTFPIPFVRLRRVTFNGIKLKRIELEELDKIAGDREAQPKVGTPDRYYVWGNRLFLYPLPSKDGEGNLEIYCVKRPEALSGDQSIPEIPEHMHEDIVRYALARAKELDQEDDRSDMIMSEYEARVALSRDETQNPEIDSYPSVRNLDGDLGYGDYPLGGWT